MTQEEKGQLFFQMKTARDAARDTLLLSRKKAQQLERQLAALKRRSAEKAHGFASERTFASRTSNSISWIVPLPAEADILDALETIRDSEKAIQEYDEFVR